MTLHRPSFVRSLLAGFAASLFASALAFAQDPVSPETPNLIHDRHFHRHNPPHPTQPQTEKRFFTTRSSDVLLPLTEEEDAFTFAVYGDRTGGPPEGVNILADAVRDTNLVEPDMVMTVGDLIQGYNGREEWLVQMREYKAIMGKLLCPWFPTSGNHDIYWRPLDDPNRPPGQHESDYEAHFGPLWYSFTHKNCNFIVLYSDEGDPETGEKALNEPNAQKVSPEQFAFLKEALARGKDCDHQFLFLHHPRWLGGGYGNDWAEKVHPALKEAGNVTAVFAGHIHHMRYDPQDGIEYVTLATVGGGQSGVAPEAGFLHHWNLVTVRKNQVAMAAFPVGAAMNVREITGKLQEEAALLAKSKPKVFGRVSIGEQGPEATTLKVEVSNPSSRPIDFTLTAGSRDNRWSVSPDHLHGRILPGEKQTLEFAVDYSRGAEFSVAYDDLVVSLGQDLIAETARYMIPATETAVEVDWKKLPAPTETSMNSALRLDGVDDALPVPSKAFALREEPFTLEAWFKAEKFGRRVALVSKMEMSEYGIFVSGGTPSASLHLGPVYRSVEGRSELAEGEWHHVAVVYDGEFIALFVNGELVNRTKGDPKHRRTVNRLPLVIGADTGTAGPSSYFTGLIDEVRLSSEALYEENFTPERRLTTNDSTVLHYDFDASLGRTVIDRSKSAAHAKLIGGARVVPAE
ncbi:MAG TPA: LamG-like jellyroll fold domain-containing protein [Pirellulaceae bacterium]|jgi:hypothetical protein|nr:LamG-like jellyroll fold domain-containing protein [Pirellulaceae bacterium]